MIGEKRQKAPVQVQNRYSRSAVGFDQNRYSSNEIRRQPQAHEPRVPASAATAKVAPFQSDLWGLEVKHPEGTTLTFGAGITFTVVMTASMLGTSNRINSTRYYNFSDGTNGTSNDIGSTTYHNLNSRRGSLNGTTNRIGSFEYHNFNNGLSGTSTQIGNSTYTNYNNGTTCVSNKVGTYTYTNCN